MGKKDASGFTLIELSMVLVINKATLTKFSRRTTQIEKTATAMEAKEAQRQADALAEGREVGKRNINKFELGARTREKKQKNMSMDELRQEWWSRLSGDEQRDSAAVAKGLGRSRLPEKHLGAKEAVQLAAEHCFERQSVVPERTFLREALRRSYGKASRESVESAAKAADLIRANKDGQKLVTTHSVLAEESSIVDFARSGRRTCPALKPGAHEFRDERLTDEQRKAVSHVLHSSDRVMLVRGAAGVGKTTMMSEAVGAIEGNAELKPNRSVSGFGGEDQGQYRQAVRALSEGRVEEGFRQLGAMGAIKEVQYDKRYEALAHEYVESVAQNKRTLIISPTHIEGEWASQHVRTAMRNSGLLGKEERVFATLENANLTAAERGDAVNLLPGDTLVYHQNARGHRKGDRVVVGAEPVALDQAHRFTVFHSNSPPRSAGDATRITSNGKCKDGRRVNNSDILTVKAFSMEGDIRRDRRPRLRVSRRQSAVSGVIVAALLCPLFTHEASQMIQLHPLLKRFDVLVADRAFCSFVELALLKERCVDAVMRLHQRRKTGAPKDYLQNVCLAIRPNQNQAQLWLRPRHLPQRRQDAFFISKHGRVFARD